jgi:hypothetical protein
MRPPLRGPRQGGPSVCGSRLRICSLSTANEAATGQSLSFNVTLYGPALRFASRTRCDRPHFLVHPALFFVARNLQIKVSLQTSPKFRCSAEGPRESKSHFG